MYSYFSFALLDWNYFQFFEYLTSLFYNMTPSKEVNSDNDDDIGSFFTVHNSAATVSSVNFERQLLLKLNNKSRR